ncbi:hypothetical protein EX30DRAFT_342604 [Ascodesmis nigricans]|uniref:Uncharacterized protein n=1 Tax=Ascodesmis nigricans TaxID=341454 RepID=A0A4S2MPP8_9PEZI|nr:hypothetical protein EX30DRAFT_342604 [Ascodesmis nigricans]
MKPKTRIVCLCTRACVCVYQTSGRVSHDRFVPPISSPHWHTHTHTHADTGFCSRYTAAPLRGLGLGLGRGNSWGY